MTARAGAAVAAGIVRAVARRSGAPSSKDSEGSVDSGYREQRVARAAAARVAEARVAEARPSVAVVAIAAVAVGAVGAVVTISRSAQGTRIVVTAVTATAGQ
jgi:hypothetical protein